MANYVPKKEELLNMDFSEDVDDLPCPFCAYYVDGDCCQGIQPQQDCNGFEKG